MEFDLKSLGIALVFWLLTMVFMWKFQLTDAEFLLWQKMAITVATLPLYYVVVNWQINR